MLKNPFQFFFGIVRFFSRKWKFLFSSIFSCFATEWMLKNLKGSTLSVFRHFETLARHSVHFFWVCNFFEKFFFKKFRFSSTVKEYLTLGSLFAIFEPWIWRRLGPVPACSALWDVSKKWNFLFPVRENVVSESYAYSSGYFSALRKW